MNNLIQTAFENEKDRYENSLFFWKQQLLRNTPMLELPADFARLSQKPQFKHISFSLPASLSNALKKLSEQTETSFFTILLATYKTLLFRYTNQAEMVIGYPFFENTINGTGNLENNCSNTKVFRSSFWGNTVFYDLLKQVNEVVLSIKKYQEVSYEKLEEEMKAEFVSNYAGLYNVLFSFSELNAENNIIDTLTCSKTALENAKATIDLALFANETVQGLSGVWLYNAELFEAITIERLATHFEVLLNGITENPNQAIEQLPMLAEAEKIQLLNASQGRNISYQNNKCVHELFEEQAAKNPTATAIVFKDQQLTYNELNERANQLACYLKSKGVKEETLVPICFTRSLEMMIGILGILKAGGAYVPVDPGYPAERIMFIVQNTKASLLLCDKESKPKLTALKNLECIELRSDSPFLKNHPTHNVKTNLSLANLAYIIYTSGSTGNPKGVMVEHGSLLNYLLNDRTKYISTNDNRAGSFIHLSYTFDASLTAMFMPLLAGKIVVIGSKSSFDVFEDSNLLKYAPYDFIKITPSHLELIQPKLKGINCNLLTQKLVIGGEALHPGHFNHFIEEGIEVEIINEYGPTEATVGCSTFSFYPVKDYKKIRKGVSIGKPIDNVQLFILSEKNELTPIGIIGEICIGGDGLSRGYLNRAELTAEKFIDNPFNTEKGSKLYKTGDLGKWLPDDNLAYVGRKDDQVKIRGYRIELGEIENVLQQSEQVLQSVVLAKEYEDGQKRLVGYYVPDWNIVKLKEREHYERHIASWKDVYESEYSKTEGQTAVDEEFNLVGWNDSFTGKSIEKEAMREWLNDITNLILSEDAGRVLEIGCGVGLIFYRLAGKVEKYIGTDLSQSSINQIKSRISKGLRNYGNAEFWVSPAHEVTLQEDERVDTIILNSMVQYFPGEDYLNDVIRRSISLLKGKGRIIIGDVIDNRLLEVFKTRLQVQKLEGGVSIEDLNWAVNQEILKEEELCISPEYFYRLQSMYPEITYINIERKQGSYVNEMTLYRYNVVIYIGIKKEVIGPGWINWKEVEKKSILEQLHKGNKIIALKDAPDPRLWKEKLFSKAFEKRETGTLRDLIATTERADTETLLIQDILIAVKSYGYHYRLLPNDDPFKVNVLIEKTKSNHFICVEKKEKSYGSTSTFTNIPLFTEIDSALKKDLLSLMRNRLPEYMIPEKLIALREMPLTNNGKINRKFLIKHENFLAYNLDNYEPPVTEIEKSLVVIWQQLLHVERVGINDNFFELGGNSIHAAILFSRIKKIYNKNLPIATLLSAATIKQLSVVLVAKEEKAASTSSLVPIQSEGTKTPLFCIHAGGGDVLFYKGLSQHLGQNQPFFALQAKGINGKELPHTKMEEMAAYYINEIRKIQPEGPYYLVGYCLGALITFEMAQQLTRQGHKVALLANVNGVAPDYVQSPVTVGIHEKEAFKEAMANISKPHKKAAKPNFMRKLLYFPIRVKNKIYRTAVISPTFLFIGYLLYQTGFRFRLLFQLGMSTAFAQTYVSLSLFILQSRYKPKEYAGSMVIFRSPGIYNDRYLGWKNLVKGEIKTINISGYHQTRRDILNEPSVKVLAKELEKFLH